MEADLRQFFGVDYRDRWRHDDDGLPRLTLRQIAVYVFRRPVPGGAVEEALVGFNPVPRLEVLVDELRRNYIAVHSKKGAHPPEPHPDRVKRTKAQQASDEARAATRRVLAAERRERRRLQLEGHG